MKNLLVLLVQYIMIKKVLEKMEGSNIVNISKIINDCINSNDIKMLKQLLKKKI